MRGFKALRAVCLFVGLLVCWFVGLLARGLELGKATGSPSARRRSTTQFKGKRD